MRREHNRYGAKGLAAACLLTLAACSSNGDGAPAPTTPPDGGTQPTPTTTTTSSGGGGLATLTIGDEEWVFANYKCQEPDGTSVLEGYGEVEKDGMRYGLIVRVRDLSDQGGSIPSEAVTHTVLLTRPQGNDVHDQLWSANNPAAPFLDSAVESLDSNFDGKRFTGQGTFLEAGTGGPDEVLVPGEVDADCG